MLFATSDGEGVVIDPVPKRGKIHLDRSALNALRARTFATYRQSGLTIRQIAETFNVSERTVSSDLAAHQARRANGQDSPADHLPGIDTD